MDRSLFVPHQDVAQVVLLEQGVIDRKYRAARIAENYVYALILQGLDDDLRTGQLVLGHLELPSSVRTRALRMPVSVFENPANSGIPTC
jgi:hypothetical protein